MFPPFEQLPFAVRMFLVATSLLILALIGAVVWRVARTIFKRNRENSG